MDTNTTKRISDHLAASVNPCIVNNSASASNNNDQIDGVVDEEGDGETDGHDDTVGVTNELDNYGENDSDDNPDDDHDAYGYEHNAGDDGDGYRIDGEVATYIEDFKKAHNAMIGQQKLSGALADGGSISGKEFYLFGAVHTDVGQRVIKILDGSLFTGINPDT
jgi:hypothetical protein